MFLANSLKEKLKKNFLENEVDNIGQAKYSYEPKPKDPRVLLSFKDENSSMGSNLFPQTTFSTQKLQALDAKEWQNTFTVDKLRQGWKTRVNLNFEDKYKKFSDDMITPHVLSCRKSVQEMIDPDILELKQKRWNISVNEKEKKRPELKQTLFEVSNGLKDFKVVPIKENVVEPGVDTRNFIDIDGSAWNLSNRFEKSEMKEIDQSNFSRAQENSSRYWKKNEDNRNNEEPFKISPERKNVEIIRYFKKYRTPFQKINDYYNTMDKVKALTFLEREQAEKNVKHENPGCEKYPEKINALVNKKMYNTYKFKYNELTGKLDKEELKKMQREKNKFKWKDDDLVNKIIAVGEMQKSNWFKNELQKSFNIPASQISKSQQKYQRTLLKPLVIKGTEIKSEEDKIKEKLDEDLKKRQKKEILLQAKTFAKKKKDAGFISKYPITKQQYQNFKQSLNDMDYKSNDFDTKKYSIPTSPVGENVFQTNTTKNQDNISRLNKSDCGPYFIEAYKKIAGIEFGKMYELNKKCKENIVFEYSHPGTYREFTFKEPVPPSGDVVPDLNKPVKKEVKKHLWSCCMNADKLARGCQKRAVKKYKWLYEP